MANGLINRMLGDDCLIEVFSYLGIYDILHVQKVCERWDILAEILWRRVLSISYNEGGWYFLQKNFSQKQKLMDPNDLDTILQRCGSYITEFNFNREYIFIGLVINMRDSLPAISIQPLLNCVNLERLTIGQFHPDNENDLSILLSKVKKLKYLRLTSTRYVTGKFFKYMPTNLEELMIDGCETLEKRYVIHALKKFKCLRTFKIRASHWCDSIAKIIGDKQTLTKLSMNGHKFKSSRSFNYLTKLVDLRELDLSCNYNLSDNSLIEILNSCKQLQSLDISDCGRISNYGIAEIFKLTALKKLTMADLEMVTDEPIGNLPNTLEYFACWGCTKVKDHGVIRLLNRTPCLTLLDVSACPQITENLVEAAIKVTATRTHSVLQLHICITSINFAIMSKLCDGRGVKEIAPFLHINYCSHDGYSDESSELSFASIESDDYNY